MDFSAIQPVPVTITYPDRERTGHIVGWGCMVTPYPAVLYADTGRVDWVDTLLARITIRAD